MGQRLSLGSFQALVRTMPRKLEQALVRGFRGAAMVLHAEVVMQIEAVGAVDLGALRNSVQTERLPDGAAVTVSAPHAASVEYGTRPHMPPVAPLEAWAARHGMADAGYPIARKIAREGTKPRRYFAKAVRAASDRMADEIADSLAASGIRGAPRRGKLRGRLRAALARGGR